MKVFNGVIYSYQSPSGKFYIGQTTREEKRKLEHKNNAKNGVKTKFYDAIRKYGYNNFRYTKIFETSSKNIENIKLILDALEKFYIKKYNSVENGYNICSGGGGTLGLDAWNKGISWTEATKRKMSASHKGKQAWNKGLKATLEQRVKLSNSHKGLPSSKKGKHLTEEQRNKVSLGLKKYFKDKTTPNARKIICVETNKIFDSIRQASIKMECNNISAVLRGTRNHTKNYHFKYID